MKKKALLDYGTHPSFPAMTVPSTKLINSDIIKASHWLTERKIEIEREFEEKAKELYEMAVDTTRVNESEHAFVPIVGKVYFLYARKVVVLEDEFDLGLDISPQNMTKDAEFLSIIEPHQWTVYTQPYKYIGKFKLNSDGVWNNITKIENEENKKDWRHWSQ